MDLNKLNKILDNHKTWLRTNGEEGERADLQWANLQGANLQGANLQGANLQGANLQGANLHEANLQWANLQGANLQWANLQGANLHEANLQWANLQGANLHEANLQGADLDFSSLPLSCKGLNVHIDDRQAIQLLYHLVKNVKFSKNTSNELKKALLLKTIIRKANEFHGVEECGKIEEE